MWTCPDCKRSFKTKNQVHSCKGIDVEYHFINKPESLKRVYDKLVSIADDLGEYSIDVIPSGISFRTSSTFLAVKTRKDHLIAEFYLNREIKGFPITMTLRTSKNRIVHAVHLQHLEDINEQFAEWLKKAYKLVSK